MKPNPIFGATDILKAFKALAYSKGYTVKIVGDWAYRHKRGRLPLMRLVRSFNTTEGDTIMVVYDTKVGVRQTARVADWLPKYKPGISNPLTKTEKDQIKKLANVQYDISRRYSYDPVKSAFYHGRSVGMGKIAKVYNPKLMCPYCHSTSITLHRKPRPIWICNNCGRSGMATNTQLREHPELIENPLRQFCCSICHRCAPKSLLPHSKFPERMSWLRHHYAKYHPVEFRKWYRRNPVVTEPRVRILAPSERPAIRKFPKSVIRELEKTRPPGLDWPFSKKLRFYEKYGLMI